MTVPFPPGADPVTPFYLTPRELAARWRIHERTLERWRKRGVGPAYARLGGAIRYSLADVEEHERDHRVGTAGDRR